MHGHERTAMNESETFSVPGCAGQTYAAEHELSAFMGAVTALFGPEQARVSAEDWLEESGLMAARPQSTIRDWRPVTIAASARLANRIDAAEHRRQSRAA